MALHLGVVSQRRPVAWIDDFAKQPQAPARTDRRAKVLAAVTARCLQRRGHPERGKYKGAARISQFVRAAFVAIKQPVSVESPLDQVQGAALQGILRR